MSLTTKKATQKEEYIYRHLQNLIDSSLNAEDLIPMVKTLLPLSFLKESLHKALDKVHTHKQSPRTSYDVLSIEEMNNPTPCRLSYLSSSSLEEILPDAITMEIVSFIRCPQVLEEFPLLSKAWRAMFKTSTTVYSDV